MRCTHTINIRFMLPSAVKRSLVFVFFFLLAQPIFFVSAEEAQIEEIVVSSYYSANSNTPVSYQNVNIDQIAEQNFGQEPSFILNRTPSVTVYSDSGSYQGYSYFRLRGMDQTRVNMTLDGAPLNEPEDQGVYFSNYPDFFSSLESLQIQRGVGMSQNGTASYAGSMQFSSPNVLASRGGRIELGYGSYNTQRIMGENYINVDDHAGVYVRASHLHSDGYKRHSSNESNSLFMSGGYVTERNAWKATTFLGNQKNDMAWLGVPKDQLKDDPRTNGNTDEQDSFQQGLIIINNEHVVNDGVSVDSGAYANYLKGNYDFDLNNFLGLASTDELYNYALRSEFYGFFSNLRLQSDALETTLGVHANRYQRRHRGSERSLGHLYENEGYRNDLSVFIKTVYDVGDYHFFMDLQKRKTTFDYDGSVEFEELEWSFFNPTAGVSFQINDALGIYYSLGRSGREPTRTDIFGGNDNLELDAGGDPIIFITKEETVLNHEFGMRYRSPNLYLDVNLYYLEFKNEIVLNGQFGPNGLALNQDVDSSIRRGVEILMELQVQSELRLDTTLSWSDATIEEQDERFEPVLTPEWIVNQELVYKQGYTTTAIGWRYQSQSFIDFANDKRLNSVFLINARASYQWHAMELRVQLNNLANRRYYTNGFVDFDGIDKYFIGAPRNLTMMVRVSF